MHTYSPSKVVMLTEKPIRTKTSISAFNCPFARGCFLKCATLPHAPIFCGLRPVHIIRNSELMSIFATQKFSFIFKSNFCRDRRGRQRKILEDFSYVQRIFYRKFFLSVEITEHLSKYVQLCNSRVELTLQ